MDDQLNPFRIDGEVTRKTPGQVVRMYLDGTAGALGGAIRAPYVAVKAIDDVVDVVKGNDLEDDVAMTRGLKYLDDAANVVTPDSELGRLSDEFIGQNLTLGGAARAVAKPGIRALTDTAQFVGAPIAGQAAIDAGANPTAALIAETAVGAAPMNFGSHRNRSDVVIGGGVQNKAAQEALETADGIYRDTGGANFGHGQIDKRRALELREEVRQDTGAYVGPDGLPRLEIFDDYIFGQRNPAGLMNVTLGDLDGMDRIVNLVPEVGKTKLRPAMDPRYPYGGSYNRDNNEITLNHFMLKDSNRDAMSVLSHELQHALQNFTGLPRGGNQDNASLFGQANLGRFSSAVNDGFFKKGGKNVKIAGGESILDPGLGQNAVFLDQVEDMRTHYGRGNSYDRYLHIAGEGEARQTQHRLFMKPETRQATKPMIPGALGDGRFIYPRNMTIRLDEAQRLLGLPIPSSGKLTSGRTIAPVPDAQLTKRGSMAATSRLPDQARVTLGFLYDQGFID